MRVLSYGLVGFFFLLSLSGWAQKPLADSLKKALAAEGKTERRVDILCRLAYDLVDFDDPAADAYIKEADELARSMHYQSGLKYALTLRGLMDFNHGDYRSALHQLQESYRQPGAQPNQFAGYNLMLMGSTYREFGRYDSAEMFYRKALAILGPDGDPYYVGSVYRGLAQISLNRWRTSGAIDLLQKAEKIARKRPGDYYTLMSIWELLGLAYQQTQDYAKSDEYFNRMCEHEKISPDVLLRIRCQLFESDMYFRRGELELALSSAFKALDMSDIYRYPIQRMEVYERIGLIYAELSQYTLSSQYYYEGLKIAEKSGTRMLIAQFHNHLAWIAKDESKFDLAIQQANLGIKIFRELGDQRGISDCENTLGLVFFLQKKYDQALITFDSAQQRREKLGHASKLAAIWFNKSLVYEARQNFMKAYELQRKSMAVDENIGSKVDIGISYNAISHLLVQLKRFEEAEDYLRKALKLAQESGSRKVRSVSYLNFAHLHEARGNFKQAAYFHNLYEVLNDSLNIQSGNMKLAELQALYEVEKKEQEVQMIAQQKKVKEEELAAQIQIGEQRKFLLVLSVVAILLLGGVIFMGFRYLQDRNRTNSDLHRLNLELTEKREEIQAQSEELMEASETISNINRELEQKIEKRTAELRQAYKELDTFFYRSSHDFRRPITTFLGLAGVAKVTVKDPVSLELFDKVSETAHNLDKMLHKLQSISDVGSQQMVYKEVLLQELITDVLSNFESTIREKMITVTTDIREVVPLVSYPAMIRIILENLIENAIHFSGPVHPTLHIRATVAAEHAVLEVEDNGQGILEQYQSRIFEMYFRANEKSKGNGLGLYISRKAVEKLHGHISFISRHGHGSVFMVQLPNRQ